MPPWWRACSARAIDRTSGSAAHVASIRPRPPQPPPARAPDFRCGDAGTTVAFRGVIRVGMTLLALVAAGAGCRGPSPALDMSSSRDLQRRVRVERAGTLLLPDGGVRWRVTSRADVGAWAWPDGRIEVAKGLVDRLDDHELAAALAHELGPRFE